MPKQKRGEPPYTCPLIDAAIENAKDHLEEIRSANEELRDWGAGLCSELDEAEKEIAKLEDQVAELETDKGCLEATIKELERDIARLEAAEG